MIKTAMTVAFKLLFLVLLVAGTMYAMSIGWAGS